MSGNMEISEKSQEESCYQINNSITLSTRKFFEDEENPADAQKKQNIYNEIFKRYSRYDLLSLRNGQISTHYPHCALQPELQALSIWTCRLRCELQYLGLWKIPNTGNSYVNCSCNGVSLSYTCNENGGQSYIPTSSPASISGNSPKYINSQQIQQQSQHASGPLSTLGSKRTVRTRERSLNYQESVNPDLIRDTSPDNNGDQHTQKNLHHAKACFIDQRSISSSHLMPAFAKRRIGHTNSTYNHIEACSNFNYNSGYNFDIMSNGDSTKNVDNFDTELKSRKELLTNNKNNFQTYKESPYSRPDKNSQYPDGQNGCMMNFVKKVNTELNSSISKSNNPLSGGNKKLVNERRIGSGRLVPRDINWEIRGNKKLNDEENSSVLRNSSSINIEKEKDFTFRDADKLNIRNSPSFRFSDREEKRQFDRRIISTHDSENSAESPIKNHFEFNYNQQQNFTGQRSMSFRRREYCDHKDHHRDFRGTKESRVARDHWEYKGGDHHYPNKHEPEWFVEGPKSQHDTIELRGFEDSDESHQQLSIRKYAKMEEKHSESSLLSHNSSSNINLSTKENFDTSGENANNSSSYIATNNIDTENDNYSNININDTRAQDEDILIQPSNIAESVTDTERKHSKPGELSDKTQKRSNENELFFDNFLNIEALENTLIGNVNEQTMSNNDEAIGGKSRFSRWFCNNLNNENDNPTTKEDAKRLGKGLNEMEFNSFMEFLKCNNFPTPLLPKTLPSNVSALSVGELEARMRKMDTGEKEAESGEGDVTQTKISENEKTITCPQSVSINSQDVEAFRKLLDQLGKPRVDISMNIILPNTSELSIPVTNSVSEMPLGMTELLPSSAIPRQTPMSQQEYVMKVMHQQHMQQQQQLQHSQPPTVVPDVHHQRMTLMSLYQQSSDNVSLVPVPPHHHHLMPMVFSQSQMRLDVQQLIQSITRGEVPLNHLEIELSKLNKAGFTSKSLPNTETFEEKSRCGTPLSAPLYIGSISTNRVGIPLSPSQVVSAQQKQSIVVNENDGTGLCDQQQAIASIIRPHHNDDASLSKILNKYTSTLTQEELQIRTRSIAQNTILKKKIDVEQHERRGCHEMHKHHELELLNPQHHQQSNSAMTQQIHQHSPRHINSPTPLAFTPTAVLRKMTAEKENTSQTIEMSSSSPQQPALKLKQRQQHTNQPRMILGGGGFQYMHQQQHHILPTSIGSPQMSPRQKAQIRNQPAVGLKWPLVSNSSIESNYSLLNNLSNKPIGRPILKGPGPTLPQINNSQCHNQSSLNPNSQSIQQINQMQKYPSMHHQQQVPRQIVGQQFSSHLLQHQTVSSQHNNIHNQHLLQQQRSVVIQSRQIQQTDSGNNPSTHLSSTTYHPVDNDNSSSTNLNYQRDDSLSPTSNQLAQWFSPELLAQASAGKLPLLNMNQALSLEEFERSIQHSSTAVHN